MFYPGDLLGSYSPYTGLAEAKTLHLAFKMVWIPPLAIDTVCCSITSCRATRSSKFILSNSSMQITPLSASTIAPASKVCFFYSSLTKAAVNPTPVEPLPVEWIQRGAIYPIFLNIWDFPTPGSPIKRMLISPLTLVSFLPKSSLPPKSIKSNPSLIASCPWIAGATDLEKRSIKS